MGTAAARGQGGELSSNGYVTVGLDYFAADHFSMGFAVTGSLGESTGVDSSTGATVTWTHFFVGLGAGAIAGGWL
ncbi:MAG TPA: hypothetical protein VGL81_17235 [Polyangiaceae bacterium]|jgi:hypothetical protein